MTGGYHPFASSILAKRALRRSHPRQEPSALDAHAGICAGGRRQRRPLPRSGRLWTMGFEPEHSRWPPLRLARVCREHVSVVVVLPAASPSANNQEVDKVRSLGRAIGLDVHRDFCEVAIAEDGEIRSCGRIATTPEQLELSGSSLDSRDRVALEVSGSAW